MAYLALAVLAACSKSDGTGPVTADHMVFLVPPSQTHSGATIAPAIQVALVDAAGTTVTGATAQVTIALAAPIPAGGALTGTLTQPTVGGIATFTNLQLGPVATGYTIEATAAGFPTITSIAFDVFSPIPAASTWIAAGSAWSCSVSAGGSYCWGHSSGGELGINSSSFRTTPAQVLTSLVYSQIAAGGSDNCGLVTPGGGAQCWGHNFAGSAGDGTTDNEHRLVPVSVVGGHTFTALSVGDDTACGITTSGAVYCWGYNSREQLGNGTTTSTSVPDSVHGGPYSSISAGGSFACALAAGGAAYCWGMNFSGNLGDGTFTDKSTPVAVTGGIVFASVKAGGVQSCGLDASGTAYCWGDNAYGEVGDATNFTRSAPTAVSGGLLFSAIVPGGDFTCGIQKTTGAAYCWGHNDVGQLGNGTIADANAPVVVSGGHSFSQLSAGFAHVCGLVTGTSAVLCWGYNVQGALGNGTTTDSHVPTAIVP